MRAAIFIVLLSIAQAGPPVPRHTADSTNQSADNTQKAPAQNKEPISPSSAPEHVPQKPMGDKASANNPTSPNTEQTIRVRELPSVSVSRDWADWALWVGSALLTIVGIIGICVAVKTLKALKIQAVIMRRQTRHIARQALSMRRQTTHLRNSVIAAKASADAIVKTERAWVDVSLQGVGPAVYHVRVINHGRTIAKVNEFRIAVEYSSGSGIPETTLTLPRSKILPPNAPWVAIELNLVTALGKEIWERVEKEKIGFSYYGVLRYDDISDQPHGTEFRFVYDAGVLTQLEAPDYNKHT